MNIRSIGVNSVYAGDYRFSAELETGTYLLVLFRSRAVVRTGGRDLHIPENTLMLYDGSCPAEYSADGSFLVCDWISFDSEGDAEFFDSASLTVNCPIRFADSGFISQLIQGLASEFYSMSTRRIKMIDAMLKTLIMKVDEACGIRENPQQAVDPHYSALIELREKIYRNPQLKWNVDTMAADVNMSRSYFQHIYREVFGVSCMTDVISGKIEKAKEILSETSCTISQVAAMCGYDNEEHFMRQFKKIVGTTPTGYRKHNT